MTELPTFDWITEPQEVPAALKKLKPKQNVVCVICRDKRRQSHLTHEATAQEHIAEIESLMSRHAMGRYTIAEIAKILAQENNLDEMKLLPRLQEAANNKKLAVTDPDTGGTPIAPNAQTLIFSHWVSPDAVNALLQEWGVFYSFAWPRPWRLPNFNVPVRPTCVPPELTKLPNEAPVRIKFSTVRVEAISTGSAADLVKLFQEIIERQGKELFTVDEAAQELAESLVGVSARAMLKDMRDAHKSGKLIIREPNTEARIPPIGEVKNLASQVQVSDVDVWLEAQGRSYRFPKATKHLNGSQSGNANQNPWLIADPEDPEPKYDWYTPARYFARQLVKADSTLLTKKVLLASRVVASLSGVGIKKRGGKKDFDSATIKKAFTGVSLG